jgi:hypothetical protein
MKAFAIIMMSVFTVSCSIQRDFDETKKTTKEMSEQTKQLKEYSEHLSKRTDDLEAELTTKEAYAMVTLNLDNLFNPDTSESDQLLFAGAAVYSMLFQYWKGDYNEDLANLDARFALHIEVLMARSLRYIPRTFDINPTLGPNHEYKAIAALGAKLDQMNPAYQRALVKNGLPNWTLLNVMLEALKNRGAMVRTEMLPNASAMVLKYKREVEYMLQLRHNYLPVMVVARMTELSDQNVAERLLGTVTGYNVDLGIDNPKGSASVDPEQLKEWTSWLKSAVALRKELKEMGIQPQINTTLTKLLRSVNFGKNRLMNLSGNLTPQQELARDFAKAYHEALQAY